MNALWYYAIGFIVVWILAFFLKGKFDNISVEGFVLMLKTDKLEHLIDRIASWSPRFWKYYINISIPLGIYAAKHQGGKIDRCVIILNQMIMSVPPCFAGILITVVFGIMLRLFTPGGYVSYERNFWGFLGYLIFPALAIALPKAAMSMKLLRSSLIEQAALDYTRTAYSRGNTTNDVLYKHVLQNAMIPVITFLGMALADIFTGSIIIEQVFNIPGLGRILLTSISNRDYPVVMAIIVLLAFAVIVINFFVDIVYHLVDPRIRAEE